MLVVFAGPLAPAPSPAPHPTFPQDSSLARTGSILPTSLSPDSGLAASRPPVLGWAEWLLKGNRDMSITNERKQEVIGEYRTHDSDTGSAEVQVAILTERVRHLTEHLKIHRKDHASRRGLLMMVGRRARLLRFVQKCDYERYAALMQRLGIRRYANRSRAYPPAFPAAQPLAHPAGATHGRRDPGSRNRKEFKKTSGAATRSAPAPPGPARGPGVTVVRQEKHGDRR